MCAILFIKGDSGYPCERFLMTPILHPRTVAEERYNNSHAKTRCTIERCNGVLKARFRCLSKHRVLNYAPRISGSIINTCVVLHNLCLKYRSDSDEETSGEENSDSSDDEDDDDEAQQLANPRATFIRDKLIRTHFN